MGLVLLSQVSKMTIFIILVLVIMFVPGVKDKVTDILNNGYSRISGISNQGFAPGDAKNSPAPGGPNGGEGQSSYREQQFPAPSQGFGKASGISTTSA
jgi:hypothetical protein